MKRIETRSTAKLHIEDQLAIETELDVIMTQNNKGYWIFQCFNETFEPVVVSWFNFLIDNPRQVEDLKCKM